MAFWFWFTFHILFAAAIGYRATTLGRSSVLWFGYAAFLPPIAFVHACLLRPIDDPGRSDSRLKIVLLSLAVAFNSLATIALSSLFTLSNFWRMEGIVFIFAIPIPFLIFTLALGYNLIFLHGIAHAARDIMGHRFIRAIDYPYLGVALLAALWKIVQMNQADTAVQTTYGFWNDGSITALVALAIALRITRTSIEVFGWHR